MLRRSLVLVTAAMLFLAACGAGDDPSIPAPDPGQVAGENDGEPADIKVSASALGSIIVDAEGFTLYIFTRDASGMSTCNDACAQTWPPVLADALPTVGAGLSAEDMSLIERDDGTSQVAFHGRALYRYSADSAAGDTNGQGVGGVWFVVDAASGDPIE